MTRAYKIAFLVRRYRLLSERPEFLTSDRAELIERILASPVTIGEFDRSVILHTDELDRLCAHAVRILTHRASASVLDILGVLEADRLAAMYYALPESRRVAVQRDVAWSYNVERAPEGVAEAVADIERRAEAMQATTARLAGLAALAPSAAREDTEAMERTLLREEVGLPVAPADAARYGGF
jgi:hypothetical protein